MTARHATWIWGIGTVVAASLAAWLVTRAEPPNRSPRPSEQTFHQWLHANLEISEPQQRELAPFEKAFERERVRLRREIREAGTELAKAIRHGSRQSPQVEAALSRLHAAQGDLQRATLDHFFTMKDHLSPGQAERLVEWTHDNILHGSPD